MWFDFTRYIDTNSLPQFIWLRPWVESPFEYSSSINLQSPHSFESEWVRQNESMQYWFILPQTPNSFILFLKQKLKIFKIKIFIFENSKIFSNLSFLCIHWYNKNFNPFAVIVVPLLLLRATGYTFETLRRRWGSARIQETHPRANDVTCNCIMCEALHTTSLI